MKLRLASSAVLALAVTLGAASAARAEFPQFKGTQPGDLSDLGQFQNADTCAACHGMGFMGDKSFLPFDTWAGTMMANAARDPVFYAALSIANQDAPATAVEHCVRCHSPISYVRGHSTPTDGSAFDIVDQQGVGCEVCHRAAQTPDANSYYLHGDAQLVFTDDQQKRGKYPDAGSPAHQIHVDDGLTKNDFCAQCHIVTLPSNNLLDSAGKDLGIAFPVETTFIEWEQSAFPNKAGDDNSCQGCHMPKKLGMLPVSGLFGEPLHPDPRQHFFVGANHWGIRAVMMANPDRAKAFPGPFQNALDNTKNFLPSAVTVTFASEPPTTLAAGQQFDVKVHVQNNTGHKFPTGYVDGRRAWVAVEIIDKDGVSHPLAGAYDPATGAISDNPPTHVYRAVHGRWDGVQGLPEHSMVKQNMLLSDTRIPPEGFKPDLRTIVTSEIDYTDGQGGYHHWDELSFSLTAPAGVTGMAKLSARVYFQTITREYVDFLKTENKTTSTGDALSMIYDATDKGPPILSGSIDAPVDFGGEGGTGGTGGTGGMAGAGGGGMAGAGGSGGSGGSGGATGGTGGTGGAGGATGGAGGTGGTGGSGGSTTKPGGCGCRTAPIDAEPLAPVAALLAIGALAQRRRRR
jgi:MYXO-CTERM domain-containing protein